MKRLLFLYLTGSSFLLTTFIANTTGSRSCLDILGLYSRPNNNVIKIKKTSISISNNSAVKSHEYYVDIEKYITSSSSKSDIKNEYIEGIGRAHINKKPTFLVVLPILEGNKYGLSKQEAMSLAAEAAATTASLGINLEEIRFILPASLSNDVAMFKSIIEDASTNINSAEIERVKELSFFRRN